MQKKLVLCFLILLSGCSAKPHVYNHAEKFKGNGDRQIYVVSHGWHTGFVIDAKQIQHKIPELKKRFEDAEYIEFGWGDKGFYQAKEITSGLTLRAIFWPTESVVHSVAVPQNVSEYFASSEVELLCLNDSELSSLVNFIASSFYRDENNNVVELKKGIYGNSQFYKGVGDYYLMNTCNKWTAKGLKSVGMDINPTFKLTAGSVMSYVKANKYEVFKESDVMDISLKSFGSGCY